MPWFFRTILALVIAGFPTVLSAPAIAQGEAKPTLTLTGIPDQDEARLSTRYARVASYLEGRLGIPVRYLPERNYSSVVTAFGNGAVQLAWFGGLTGLRARQLVPGSLALAQGAEDAGFRSYIIANADLGLERSAAFPTDTAGRTFVFGARSSTSGYLVPAYHIRKAFVDKPLDEIYARIGYSGEHSRTIKLVQNGTFDLGAVDSSVWMLDDKAGKIDRDRVRVVWETPPYPNNQWSLRGDADQTFGKGFTERVRQALLGLDDPAILDLFGRSKFVPVSNAAYEPLVAIGKAMDALE